MLNKIFPSCLSAVAISLGLGLAVVSGSVANAGGHGWNKPAVTITTTYRGHGGRHQGTRYKRHKPYYHRRTCTPRMAVYKAKRTGLRHVRVEHSGRRFVVVSGRKYRGGVRMGFHRKSKHCSVAFVQRNHHRRGHYRRY